MRLEHNDRALVAERFNGVKQRLELTGMMGVIVVNICAVVLALKFKPAVRTGESGKTVADGRGTAPETDRRRRSRERILHIVDAGDAEAHVREHLFAVNDVKLRLRAVLHDIGGIDIRPLFRPNVKISRRAARERPWCFCPRRSQ